MKKKKYDKAFNLCLFGGIGLCFLAFIPAALEYETIAFGVMVVGALIWGIAIGLAACEKAVKKATEAETATKILPKSG